MIDTSPVVSIWLKMSTKWHTKSQGPKKKCIHFSRGRINPWPAHTARNKGSFTPYALWSVKSLNSPTVSSKKEELFEINQIIVVEAWIWWYPTVMSNLLF